MQLLFAQKIKGIGINTLAFKYTIRRSQRAKKTRIIVTSDKIEVVAPLLVSIRKIHAFVHAQQDWIVAATDKIEFKNQNIKKLGPENYIEGVAVPFHGQQVKISLADSLSKEVQVKFNAQTFKIYLPTEKLEGDSSEFVRLALTEWMKDQALKEVEGLVECYAKKYNLHPRHIKIKTQKSRWGSCGIHNDININWLLILAPPEVMEYVVVHELCHIKERNHSARFWQLVEAHLPDYKKQRNWLKLNGSCLMQGL